MPFQSPPSSPPSSPGPTTPPPASIAQAQANAAASQKTELASAKKEKGAPPLTPPHAFLDIEESSTEHPNSTVTPGTVPRDILALLDSIIKTINTYFSTYPPHTVQRMAELIFEPKKHYRYLPTYLHALDRVIHVTSGANNYPLPAAVPDAAGAKILTNGMTDPESISWGTSIQAPQNFGGDESLGGALLTPIPWLKSLSTTNGTNTELEGEVKTESTETIDGPNGPGGVETVSVSVNGVPSATLAAINGEPSSETALRAEGGITQGELLRQEQEAGVVPVSQLRSTHPNGDGEEGDAPHARGPDAIGDEDIGPQHPTDRVIQYGIVAIDLPEAVGRPQSPMPGSAAAVASPESEGKREAEDELGGENKRVRDGSDAEVKHEDDKKDADEYLKTEEADAMDTTE